MYTEEEDHELDRETLGEPRADDEGDRDEAAPVVDDDADTRQDAADYEDPAHRAQIRQGKKKAVPIATKPVKAGSKDTNPVKSTKPAKHSKVIDAELQDLWVLVNEKAKKLNRSPAQALADAGFVMSLSRRRNPWNVYRTWLCLQPNRPPGTKILTNVFAASNYVRR